MAVTPSTQTEAEELLNLGAVDGEFYCRQWFPNSARQSSPPYLRELWSALESHHRYVGAEVFRGGAKTTVLRMFTSKRIAYGVSRTIMYVSESQDHAKRSVRWIRRQVLHNTAWANFFQLRLGTKKTDEWLEIIHGVEEIPITILAVGITGQTRGINLDDWRPDLIIVDDPCDEENTGTEEQRNKIHKLFFGALAKSLAPPIDSDNALMCLLQTPLNEFDLISRCRSDPQWHSLTFGCFDEEGKSRWEERYPLKFLLAEKQAHIERNDLPLWYAEMECRIIAESAARFRQKWLKPYPETLTVEDMLDEGGQAFLWIDPVPPPSERQLAKGLAGKDWEVLAVVIKFKNSIYLAEYAMERGHEPDWTIREFWRLVDKYRVTQFGVELKGYQRTLKWLIEQSMQQRGRYLQIYEAKKEDNRKKSYRIIDSLKNITSQGQFYVKFDEHSEFIEQYTSYPAVVHDDVIEAVAEATRIALEYLTLEGVYDRIDDEDEPALKMIGGCP